jgi:hypothetical protein
VKAFIWRNPVRPTCRCSAERHYPRLSPPTRHLQWLQGREDQDPWNFVWRILVEHADGLPEGTTLTSLLQLGFQWLQGREDQDQWNFVWQILLQHADALPEGTTLTSLLQLGIQWLIGRADNPSWSFVFENCLRNRVTESKFLSLGVDWVLVNSQRAETFGIAQQLTKYAYKIPPIEKYKLQNWIKNWVYKSDVKSKSWTYGWNAYWNMMPTLETVEIALKWIEVNPENKKGNKWMIKTLFETQRPDVINRITKWHEKHLDHPISEIIKQQLP